MDGQVRIDQVLEPVSGQALPVLKGETLRITQIEGGQCVDFNAFNLHDYKERMSVGHSRQAGLRLVEGDVLLSNPPRHRPMVWLSHLADSCVTDTLGARCDAVLFEEMYGFSFHTNCQDTFAEAIREYDLTPDDVHDSFNMFMNTAWNEAGAWWIDWNTGQRDEFVDLMACMDTLCVPIVCGSGDIAPTSNFFLKPIRIQVLESTSQTLERVEDLERQFAAPNSRQTVASFKVQNIKADRELSANEDYEPDYPAYPLSRERVTVELTSNVDEWLTQLVDSGFSPDRADAARRVVMVRLIKEALADREGLGSAQRRFPHLPEYRRERP